MLTSCSIYKAEEPFRNLVALDTTWGTLAEPNHLKLAGDGTWNSQAQDGAFAVLSNDASVMGVIPYFSRSGSSTHTELWSIIFGLLMGLHKWWQSSEIEDLPEVPNLKVSQLQDNQSSIQITQQVFKGRFNGIKGMRKLRNSPTGIEIDTLRRLWEVAKDKVYLTLEWVTSHKVGEKDITEEERARRVANQH